MRRVTISVFFIFFAFSVMGTTAYSAQDPIFNLTSPPSFGKVLRVFTLGTFVCCDALKFPLQFRTPARMHLPCAKIENEVFWGILNSSLPVMSHSTPVTPLTNSSKFLHAKDFVEISTPENFCKVFLRLISEQLYYKNSAPVERQISQTFEKLAAKERHDFMIYFSHKYEELMINCHIEPSHVVPLKIFTSMHIEFPQVFYSALISYLDGNLIDLLWEVITGKKQKNRIFNPLNTNLETGEIPAQEVDHGLSQLLSRLFNVTIPINRYK